MIEVFLGFAVVALVIAVGVAGVCLYMLVTIANGFRR